MPVLCKLHAILAARTMSKMPRRFARQLVGKMTRFVPGGRARICYESDLGDLACADLGVPHGEQSSPIDEIILATMPRTRSAL